MCICVDICRLPRRLAYGVNCRRPRWAGSAPPLARGIRVGGTRNTVKTRASIPEGCVELALSTVVQRHGVQTWQL